MRSSSALRARTKLSEPFITLGVFTNSVIAVGLRRERTFSGYRQVIELLLEIYCPDKSGRHGLVIVLENQPCSCSLAGQRHPPHLPVY